jgi:hypothetical protein
MYIEFPVAFCFDQALIWIKSGGELRQEDTQDLPDCLGIEDEAHLFELFPELELDASDNVHLVVSPAPEITQCPFKVGQFVMCGEDLPYMGGQVEEDKIAKGEVVCIDRIEGNQLFFHEHADRYGGWEWEEFLSLENCQSQVTNDMRANTHKAMQFATKDMTASSALEGIEALSTLIRKLPLRVLAQAVGKISQNEEALQDLLFTILNSNMRLCVSECPKCQADENNVEWGDKEWSGSMNAWQNGTCSQCGTKFTETYKYVGTEVDEIQD